MKPELRRKRQALSLLLNMRCRIEILITARGHELGGSRIRENSDSGGRFNLKSHDFDYRQTSHS